MFKGGTEDDYIVKEIYENYIVVDNMYIIMYTYIYRMSISYINSTC